MTEGEETSTDVSLTSPSVTASRRHLPLAGEELASSASPFGLDLRDAPFPSPKGACPSASSAPLREIRSSVAASRLRGLARTIAAAAP
ncbi:hypothetical protein D9602_04225 [Sphingomonas sp. TX0522]|nr:hypothetical protein [Sphingomonas sp. TX0522]